MKIDRLRVDGEPVRRFFLIAEVTFADREADPMAVYRHNYYEDRELRDLVTGWMQGALEDRDDCPAVRFHAVPQILDVDMQSIARGDYPEEDSNG